MKSINYELKNENLNSGTIVVVVVAVVAVVIVVAFLLP